MAVPPMSASAPPSQIPSQIVEYFLLGRTSSDAVERYMLDGGVVTDVWLAFSRALDQPVRMLLAPCTGTTAMDMAHQFHKAIQQYRAAGCPGPKLIPLAPAKRVPTAISPLSTYATATIYLDELIRVVMPLTRWWRDKRLNLIRAQALRDDDELRFKLADELQAKLGRQRADVKRRKGEERDWAMIEALPIAALIGVFALVAQRQATFNDLFPPGASPATQSGAIFDWVSRQAKDIAIAAEQEFAEEYAPGLLDLTALSDGLTPDGQSKEDGPVPLIGRVFLDRTAKLSEMDALTTIKADACERLFDYSCRSISWAVIDSGIATQHPAFIDWTKVKEDAARRARRGQPSLPQARPRPSRVKAAYDFTLISRIRSLDLTNDPGTPASKARINALIDKLAELPGQQATPEWRDRARSKLLEIINQLSQRIPPDWSLIEPLIRVQGDDGAGLPSDHGTHVAGILGGDWWKEAPDGERSYLLQRGVCPDIYLYDLRVIPAPLGDAREALEATEFAVLAAIEFVGFLNTRAGPNSMVVHGVNISMSIPHEVRSYGCGSTPVCVACDDLVGAGVTVVAAAGNRGWNEQEIGFGTFVFCSITDPGNAYDVITVGSTHKERPHTYGVSYFSSRGPTGDGRAKPDIVAPGERISAPARGDALIDRDGTSFAAPYVSGAAAILMARNKEFIGKPRRVKEVLLESATDLGRERYFQGRGLLDILRALQSV